MLKLVIGNKAYSSWSLRGWLAVKQSGLPFEEVVVPMDGPEFAAAKQDPNLLPSAKVPVLWDGPVAVWESLAIVEFLADRVGRERYWPLDDGARALARSIAAEMHSGFAALRRHCPMNVRRRYDGFPLTSDVEADIARIDTLWCEARGRFGKVRGDYLFGEFGGADIMYAPVVARFATYDVRLSDTARAYAEAVMTHPWMRRWIEDAQSESWVLERFEF